MPDNIEDLDSYLETFLGKEEIEQDDFDFFDYLFVLALFEVTIFTATLQSSIERLQFEGLTNPQIRERIKTQYNNKTGAFAVLFNSAEDIIRYGIRESSRLGMLAIYNQVLGDNIPYRWVVARGVKHCEDCETRSGEVRQFADWTALGLPASGWSRCNFRCYCILDPLENIDSVVQV